MFANIRFLSALFTRMVHHRETTDFQFESSLLTAHVKS